MRWVWLYKKFYKLHTVQEHSFRDTEVGFLSAKVFFNDQFISYLCNRFVKQIRNLLVLLLYLGTRCARNKLLATPDVFSPNLLFAQSFTMLIAAI